MKKIFLTFIGIIIVILLVAFNHYTRVYFNNNDKIIKNLNLLKQKELQLNYEIFTTSVYLYKNFDSIVTLENQIDTILNILTKDKEFTQKTKTYEDFLIYKRDIKNKIMKIYELEAVIAPLKNADMYVSELITKLPIEKLPKKDKTLWLHITSNIFLAKSSLDKTFIQNLNKDLKSLNNVKNDKYNEIFIKNIELINQFFPRYVKGMNEILHYKTKNELQKCFNDFLVETNDKLRIITFVSILLILFVILSIFLILFLFVSLEKENKILEEIVIIDDLTKLYNRRKLKEDLKDNQVLFIINIDRFKYYNDLYGIDVGDFILQDTAKKIKDIFPRNIKASFYRLGADDFGVLCPKYSDKKLKEIAQNIIHYIKHSAIKYGDIEFHLMVSIGISYYKPLIETSDIVLKEIKKDKKLSFAIYDPSLKEKQRLEENMEKVAILKDAIKHDKIIPYYQPIFSNKTGKIVKYEVLARIITDNKVMSIYPFLDVAKENREYKYITQMIYSKAFEKFKNTDIEFSLNLSIEDINNEETMEFIYQLLSDYPKTFRQLTFEILEDDAINNYDDLKQFIKLVKKHGSKVAIDDFGSGYSNFAHVLNLDIDYLKIDGSLIKNLDKDAKMELIVETIVDFAKKTNMKVIAEYVATKEILQKVKKLNIDYSQGFYLGEPTEDLV